MQIKALAAALLVAGLGAVFLHTTHALALSQTTTANTTANVAASPPPDPTVTVQPGDSLSKIATANSTTYVRIYDANDVVQDPDVIYPGQVLTIPAADEQLPDRMAAVAAPVAAPTTTYAPRTTRTTHVVSASDTSAPSGGVWAAIAQCESGGNWSINTGNGYYGGLQFSLSSWRAVGGSGLPSDASASEQISRAQALQAREGWGAWPVCSVRAGV